jgi:hypothetical protein
MPRDRRRSRRRRHSGLDLVRLLALLAGVALVVVLVVGSLASVGPASATFHRTLAQGFATLATPLAASSNATGAELFATLDDVGSLSRPDLFSRLDAAASDAAAQARAMAEAGSPAVPGGASAGCVRAMADRAAAVTALRDGIEQVLGGRTGSSGTAGDQPSALRLVVPAGARIAAADAEWAACRGALTARWRGARVPQSVWVTGTGAGAADAGAMTALVATVLGSRALEARPALAITNLTTDPSPVVSGPGPGVVPPTMTLVAHLLVVNTGNVDVAGVRVTGTLTGPGAGGPGTSSAVDVAAGRSVAVTLPPLGVRPGATYSLSVVGVDASGAQRASATTVLAVAAPPPTTTTTVPPRTTTTTAPGRTTTTTRHALAPSGRHGGTSGPPAP